MMPKTDREESIPSLERTPKARTALAYETAAPAFGAAQLCR